MWGSKGDELCKVDQYSGALACYNKAIELIDKNSSTILGSEDEWI
jgi:hypothetical protein